MIVEFGHLALIMALACAVIQIIAPTVGIRLGDTRLMHLTAPAALIQFFCVSIAFLALIYAHVTSDFSVVNVAQNSNSLEPLFYKIAGAWGNHEGSLLLWVAILGLFSALIALLGRSLPLRLKIRVLSVQAVISCAFLLFIILTSNPFLRQFPAPLEGGALNPLLQDPGLAFHPPMLYLGYVGLSVSYSFAVAALLEGHIDAVWARYVRPWALLAWICLTIGIGFGSWWAYYELGWGGFWYWDPVENASLMPWLIATALLHSAIVAEKRDSLKSWTILLAIFGFSFSLIGTFLVRSGVLDSVHAFANDPRRGAVILIMIGVAIGGSLLLYALRAGSIKSGGSFRLISREGGILINNLLLTVATITVLIGTLFPLFYELATGGGKISVGVPFYNATFVPIMIPLLIVMGLAPSLTWKRGQLGRLRSKAFYGLIFALIFTVLFAFIFSILNFWVWIGLMLAGWVGATTLANLFGSIFIKGKGGRRIWRNLKRISRSKWGMYCAHLGMAFVVAGACGASLMTQEKILNMKIGNTVALANYKLRLNSVKTVEGPNYIALRGAFSVFRKGKPVTTLYPERRQYMVGGNPTTEAALNTRLLRDIYVVIGEKTKNGGYVVRMYYKPLAPWLWIGCLLMALGGLLSLSDRRLRIGLSLPSLHHGSKKGHESKKAALKKGTKQVGHS